MEPEEILEKLRPAMEKEGLQVELIGHTAQRVEVRAKRVARGVPVAFLMKAIEGTFRRYHPSIKEIYLSEYDPGENLGDAPAPSSDEFEKVWKHKALGTVSKKGISETMGLDLSGTDRASAIRALENVHRVWSGRDVRRFLVRGIEEDGAQRALEKWLAHYQLATAEHREGDIHVIHLEGACEGGQCWSEPVMWMPARVVLIS